MKFFMVALICFLLGFGAFWGYNKFQILITENNRLKSIQNNLPSNASEEIPSPTVIAITQMAAKGQISGKLGYPSEAIPQLTVYAFDILDEKKYFKVETKVNQNDFIISEVDPGSYFLVAYATGYEASGAYTKAVPCGLTVECTDHSMIAVTVNSGEKNSTVEIRDWYAAPGSFPKKPLN